MASSKQMLENISKDTITSPTYNFCQEKVLFVDDDAKILSTMKRQFRSAFIIDTAESGAAGLELLNNGEEYAVIVADMKMPYMDGVEFLKKAKVASHDSIRIMLTGNADQKTAIDAVNQGQIYQFLNKPCDKDVLEMTIKSAIKYYWLSQAERELFEKTLHGSVKIMTELLSMTRPQLFKHAIKLQDLAEDFGKHMEAEKPWVMKLAIMLSQIGFMTITDELAGRVRANRSFTAKEEEIVSKIPLNTATLLSQIPHLGEVAYVVSHLDTQFNGFNSPDRSEGDDIPKASRIIKILSDYLNLQSHGQSKQQALETMFQRKGWYDPSILFSFKSWLLEHQVSATKKKAVSLNELKIGDIIMQDIVSPNGNCLLDAYERITAIRLQQLHNLSELIGLVEPVYIEDYSE
ncbi:MAG: HD domain-containing phosphohydrolase [Verrucomicrobiota bacterium]